jgi:DNA replication protein DnaC
VRFVTASDMLAERAGQGSSSGLARCVRRYTVPHLLCVDEVGYLSSAAAMPTSSSRSSPRRYDAGKPVLLSINKAFSEWNEVFTHAACVVTLVDRLIHRAEVIDIEADSYRLKEAKELTAAHAKRRTKKPTPS